LFAPPPIPHRQGVEESQLRAPKRPIRTADEQDDVAVHHERAIATALKATCRTLGCQLNGPVIPMTAPLGYS